MSSTLPNLKSGQFSYSIPTHPQGEDLTKLYYTCIRRITCQARVEEDRITNSIGSRVANRVKDETMREATPPAFIGADMELEMCELISMRLMWLLVSTAVAGSQLVFSQWQALPGLPSAQSLDQNIPNRHQ